MLASDFDTVAIFPSFSNCFDFADLSKCSFLTSFQTMGFGVGDRFNKSTTKSNSVAIRKRRKSNMLSRYARDGHWKSVICDAS